VVLRLPSLTVLAVRSRLLLAARHKRLRTTVAPLLGVPPRGLLTVPRPRAAQAVLAARRLHGLPARLPVAPLTAVLLPVRVLIGAGPLFVLLLLAAQRQRQVVAAPVLGQLALAVPARRRQVVVAAVAIRPAVLPAGAVLTRPAAAALQVAPTRLAAVAAVRRRLAVAAAAGVLLPAAAAALPLAVGLAPAVDAVDCKPITD